MATNVVANFEGWSATEFAEYMKREENLGDYYEAIIKHDITGKIAPRISDQDLRYDLGIEKVGDRLRFKDAVEKLQSMQREKQRDEVIWEGEQMLYFSCYDQCCSTCCFCCPQDPSTYKLTNTRLVIKTVRPQRCGPITCFFGKSYEVDNIDLTYITSTDVSGIPPPCCQKICCCGKTQDHVHIKTSSEGEKKLVLPKREGETVSKIIMHKVEECQRMERD